MQFHPIERAPHVPIRERGRPPAPKRPSKVTVPERAHPLAKLLFSEMQRQGVTYAELEWRSGVLISTYKAYRTDNNPGLITIQAALGALDWELVPVPSLSTLSPEVLAAIEEIGQHFRSDQEAIGAAILAAAALPQYAIERQPRVTRLAPGSLPAQRLAEAAEQ